MRSEHAKRGKKKRGSLLVATGDFFEKELGMSFGIYLVGFLILVAGLIYGAVLLHIAPQWIAVGAIVLVGLGLVKGVQSTRGKDPS